MEHASMTADTLTKDQSIELMQAEIERLRDDIGAADITIGVQGKEIERLRAALTADDEGSGDVTDGIRDYLASGGLFNPELMDHQRVRDLLIESRDEIERLREGLDSMIAHNDIQHAEIERMRRENDDLNAGWQRTYDHDCNLLKTEVERLRELLRGWRDAAEIAQDITFAPIAKATDEALPGLRWSLRF